MELINNFLNKNRHIFLLIGLFVVFVLQFLIGSKLFYFFTYLLLALIFYIYSGNVNKSLIYSLIIAFFSESGIGSSLFRMEPLFINSDSGWMVSPITMLITILFPLTLLTKRNIFRVYFTDYAVILFLFTNFIILLFYPYAENILYALIGLVELTVAYFLLRLNLTKEDLRIIPILLISILIYNSFLGLLQFSFGRNIGQNIEIVNYIYPYGLTAAEDENIFRVTGTAGHANLFAITIVTLLPFILLSKKYTFFILGFVYLVLILTFSRLAWLIGGVLTFFMTYIYIKSKNWLKITNKISFIFFILLPLMLSPLIVMRLNTIPEAFAEGGSWDVRIKVWREALNLFIQSLFIGIGPNRFQQLASEQGITNVFIRSGFSPSTKIHNIFLELLTETGLIGFISFLVIIISLFYYLIQKKIKSLFSLDFNNILVLSLSSLLLISQFHPIFHTVQFRLYYLLAALILV